MTEILNSVMRESWQTMIAKIEKYYSHAKNESGWTFIVPAAKAWTFDILNRCWVNVDKHDCWHDTMHPNFYAGCNAKWGYRDMEEHKAKYITTHKYLNGNTLVHIYEEDY